MKTKFEFGCVMLFFDNPLLEVMQNEILEEDLHEYGLEVEPHISLFYGLHSGEIPPQIVIKECSILYSPIKTTGVSLFKNLEFEVIKIDVDSPDLRYVNRCLEKLPNTRQFDKFVPHSTIAYVKPGTGEKYLKRFNAILAENPLQFFPDRIVYSMPNEKKIIQKLSTRNRI